MSEGKTDPVEVFHDLDGGVFMEKVSQALSSVAEGVVHNGRKGKVVLTLDMKRIGEGRQVMVGHSVDYERPTTRGKQTEKDTTSTAMYVGQGGKLSIMPDTQQRLFSGGDGGTA